MANERGSASAAATRWVELIVALLIAVGGAVVIVDSIRIGTGWAADGPQSGYFPNFIGWILVGAGLWIAGRTLLRWRPLAGKSFVSRAEIKPVLLMALPTAAYVAVLSVLGIYVASALYIATFMIWQGRYRLLPALLVSIGLPAVLFVLFEVWFLVPLPKGPLEHLLGF